MRAGLFVLMLAACSDVHGVAVLVHPNNADVRWVRVFVGTGGGTTADLTGGASTVPAMGASYFTRDPGNACDSCDVVAVSPGTDTVKFGFITDDGVPAVIAVGYDASMQPIVAGVAHDLATSDHTNDFFGYDLDLAPFQPFSTTSSSLQLELWSPPDGAPDPFHAACAGIIDANADHPYFVVRHDDEDCDGLINGDPAECTPDTYLGTAPADADQATCLNTDAHGCEIGGFACKDNTPTNMSGCTPSTTCLPASVCGACGMDYKCSAEIFDHGFDPATISHYTCIVSLDVDGTVCPDLLALDRPPTGGFDCKGVEIGAGLMHLSNKVDTDGLTITADEHVDPQTSCAATLSFQGTPTQTTVSALVEYQLANGAGIALPVAIQFQAGGCAATPKGCTLDDAPFADPAQAACATAWKVPTDLVQIPGTDGLDLADPTLTTDQKEMLYESGGMLFQTKRSNGNWSTPSAVIVTAAGDDHAPELSADGTDLLFIGSPAGPGDLYAAHRSQVGTQFGMGVPIINADPQFTPTAATFAPDDPAGPHLIVAGTLSGGSNLLYAVDLDAASTMILQKTPLQLGVVGADHPHLSPDGLHLYFDGGVGPMTTLWVASRRTKADAFAQAVRLPELDSASPTSVSSGAWVGAGARTIYFAHGDAAKKQIYTTTR